MTRTASGEGARERDGVYLCIEVLILRAELKWYVLHRTGGGLVVFYVWCSFSRNGFWQFLFQVCESSSSWTVCISYVMTGRFQAFVMETVITLHTIIFIFCIFQIYNLCVAQTQPV